MGFFNNFPYTNFHDLNLDWILRELEKTSGEISTIPGKVKKEVIKELEKTIPESVEKYVDSLELNETISENVAKAVYLQTRSVQEFGASGLDTVHTGNINGNFLTLDREGDFEVGNGIYIDGAGEFCTENKPTNVNISGIPGEYSVTYQICGADIFGGLTSPISGSASNVSAPSDKTPIVIKFESGAYCNAIFKNGELIGYTKPGATQFIDRGFSKISDIELPVSNTRKFFTAKVVEIDSTKKILKLDNDTDFKGNCTILHDDTDAINNAVKNGKTQVSFGRGVYNISNRIYTGVYPGSVILYGSTVLNGGGSTIKLLNSHIYSRPFINKANVYGGFSDNDITIKNFVFDGGCDVQNISSDANTFGEAVLYIAFNNPSYRPQRISITDCIIKNTNAAAITLAGVYQGIVSGCKIYNSGRDGILCADNSEKCVIISNSIYVSGDDGIGISSREGLVNKYCVVVGNSIYNSGSRGINVQGEGHVICSNSIDGTAWSGIEINCNDGNFATKYISCASNFIGRVGECRTGINGWTTDEVTKYGIKIYNGKFGAENELEHIACSSNSINFVKPFGLEDENSTNTINCVKLVGNVFPYGSDITLPSYLRGFLCENEKQSGVNVVAVDGSLSKDVPVIFDWPLAAPPRISINVECDVATSFVNVASYGLTKTGFTLRCFSNTAQNLRITWIAEA